MQFRTIPLRTGLGLAIVLMGAFSILLVYISEEIDSNHAIANQRSAVAQLLRYQSMDLLAHLENNAIRLGLDLQQDAGIRTAVQASDSAAITPLLDNRFRQYFVTAGILKLEKLTVYDADFRILASSSRGLPLASGGVVCPGLAAAGRSRAGPARLQPQAQLCVYGNLPLYAVLVPIGLQPDGYIQVTTDPRHDLTKLEARLGMPLRLTLDDGTVSYQSGQWDANGPGPRALDVDFPLQDKDGATLLTATLRMDMDGFFSGLRRTRDLVMLMVALATLVTVVLVRQLSERLIIRPLHSLCSELRQRAAPARPVQPPAGRLDVICEFAELKELYGVLADISLTDPLTGLANRVRFEQQLEALLLEQDTLPREHAACYLDLDHFRIVNDTCGHPAGDRLLQEVAILFSRTVRPGDLVARFGGDEFAILLQDCPERQARQIAGQLNAALGSYQFSWDGRAYNVGVSIGVVAFHPGNRLTEVIGAADAACYLAKAHGRNRMQFYRPDDRELQARRDETRWANRIARALEDDRLELFAQPIHRAILGTSRETIHEILLWMIDEEGNRISPREFIPAAERYGMMDAIDRWVIRQLCLQLGTRDEPDPATTWTINLSGQSLSDDNFLNFLIDTLDRSRIDTRRFCFEITETAAITNLDKATTLISILKGMGIRFALDDFGSGLSSFTYLKHLRVDYVKIDGSFVRGMAGNSIDRRMVEAINQMAHAMDIRTIAECVENEESYAMLQDIGVDYLQGYYTGRPQPLGALLSRRQPERDTGARVVPIR